MRTIGLLTLACALFGCRPSRVLLLPPADADASASVGEDSGDDCARACRVIGSFGCPEAIAYNCPAICRRDQAQGVGAQLDVGCVLAATSRDALRLCRVACDTP